jgi:hypothetical protein
MLNKLSLA